MSEPTFLEKKKKKKNVSLLSAEFAHRVVKGKKSHHFFFSPGRQLSVSKNVLPLQNAAKLQ